MQNNSTPHTSAPPGCRSAMYPPAEDHVDAFTRSNLAHLQAGGSSWNIARVCAAPLLVSPRRRTMQG